MDPMEKTLTIYAHAVADHEFKRDIMSADGDDISGPHDLMKKGIIATTYFGYLVGKKGPENWANGLGISTNPQSRPKMGIDESDVEKARRVKYIPDHAHGDPDHPDCEEGCIKHMAHTVFFGELPAAFVLYDNLDTKMVTGDEPYTAKRTRLENLIFI